MSEEKVSCCVTDFTTKPQSNGHDCCSVQPKSKQECPTCKQKAKGVLSKTLEHLLTSSAKSKLDYLEGFYYCKTPACKTVYFREDETLNSSDVSVSIGLKDGSNPANMCYCFGWSKEKMIEDIKQNGKSTTLDDIKEKMNTIGCSCEIKNPSGSCCMADISKVLKEMTSKVCY